MRLQFGLPALAPHDPRSGLVHFLFRADLDMRGLAISFLTPASVALPDFFLTFFFIEYR
jgi:hypothetical protein